MERPDATKNADVYNASRLISRKRKENFSWNFMPEYLVVSENCVTHTHTHTHTHIPPPITRALRYLLSSSLQKKFIPFCRLFAYCLLMKPKTGTGKVNLLILYITTRL